MFINRVPDDKILALSELKAFADDNFNVAQLAQFFLNTAENIVAKGKKCGLLAFSAVSIRFSKAALFVIETGNVIKGI